MKTIIFDFDGTLGDSFSLAVALFYEMTGRHPLPDDEVAMLRRVPMAKLPKVLHLRFWQVPRLLVRGRKLMYGRMHEVKAFAGIEPVVRELHDQGVRLFVVSSNSAQNLARFLETHSLRDCFEGVYGGAGLFGKAPILKKIMHRHQIDPAECWYVGDEVRDIHGAHGAHLPVAAVTWGYQDRQTLEAEHPERLIDDPAQLLSLFDK